MIGKILIFFGLVGIALVGVWTQTLRQENAALKHKLRELELRTPPPEAAWTPPSPQSPPAAEDLRQQLNTGRKRLQALQNNLANLLKDAKPAAPEGVEAHIGEDEAQIAKANEEMGRLNEDTKTVAERSKNYREQRELNRASQKIEFESQLRQVDETIRRLKGELGAANREKPSADKKMKIQDLNQQLQTLALQRVSLGKQIQQLTLASKSENLAITEEVQSEHREMNGDRNEVQRRLGQLKTDLQHWRSAKADQVRTSQIHDQAVTKARQEILQETSKIKVLEEALKAAKP